MAVKCGWASIDERGRISGGKAGDQTGKELRTGNWYKFGQTVVYRWKDRKKAKEFAACIESLCNNSNIGYDQGQGQRTTLNSALKKIDWKYKNLKTKCECDCSALVVAGVNCVAKKQLLSPSLYTGNIGDALMKTGLFIKLSGVRYCNSDSYLATGDIINHPGSHVIVALANGSKTAAAEKKAAKKTDTKPAPAKASTAVKFTYAVKAGGKKLPAVTNTKDFAGVRGKAITDIAIKTNKGSVKYRVHVKGGKWLPYVTGYSWKNAKNGYAGNGKPIDAVQVILSGVSGKVAKYHVSPLNGNYYAWQKNGQKSGGQDGYAGSYGKAIDRIQITEG